ncbi:MAG: IS21 family transposase [Anaerolineae bacterium]|nr:IS21 family transposase [Anaerolineae bacterium]
MKKIRSLIRLKSTTEMSDRQIARALQIARPLVSKYWTALQAGGLDVGQIEKMSDSDLLAALEGGFRGPQVEEKEDSRHGRLREKFPHFVVELKRTGVTLQCLWQEYLAENPDGYRYSQFCYHFQRWRESSDVRMHIEHKAGEKVFVDYAGQKLALTDAKTGEVRPVEVFVAILGASELTYVEASRSQGTEDWVLSNDRALRFFGGVVQALIPDNLKSGVSRVDPYEPGINPTFDDFAEHYGVVIMPARVRKARDKALVENGVRLIYQRIYAPLRDRKFFSLAELNEAIRDLLEQHNNRRFSRLPYSRRELFERVERGALGRLPAESYRLKTTRWATVGVNYHVELPADRHYYSVPHYLYSSDPKTKVLMVYDERVVALYYDHVRIVQYQRDRTPNGYTTLPQHMPEHHRWYAKWSPARLLNWARSIGPETEQIIEKVLESRKYPPQAFKSCMGILALAKEHGHGRLNRACRRALSFGLYSLSGIRNILDRRLEEESSPELDLQLGEHENLRGSAYYN